MLSGQSITNGGEQTLFDKYQDLINTMSGINYIIDQTYKIQVYTQEKWNAFAMKNSGSELLEPASVKGKSILDNFAGKKVKEYYLKIYDLIFKGDRQEIVIKAKCDAPEVLRDNVIYLTPIYNNLESKDTVIGVLHQSLILKVDERAKTANFLHKGNKLSSDARFLEICSICKFILYETEDATEWISTEAYYQLGGIDDMTLEHSICDDCSIMLDEFL